MQLIHGLWHYELESTEGSEWDVDEHNPKFIGTYSSEEEAEGAIAFLKDQPGFRDWPGGFWVNSYNLDRTGWEGGFISIDECLAAYEAEAELAADEPPDGV